jgi:hypothetical protein
MPFDMQHQKVHLVISSERRLLVSLAAFDAIGRVHLERSSERRLLVSFAAFDAIGRSAPREI